MAHIHPISDANAHFIIDAATRTISSSDGSNLIIVQGDHNSEKVTFELPRHIENHDMSLCNVVQVHYINMGTGKANVSKGLYEVTDLQLVDDRDDVVQCSWTISRNATMFAGSLSFVVSFKCSTSEAPDYVWNTAIYAGLAVCESIDSTDYVVTMYADVLETWRKELYELAHIDAEEIQSAVAAYLEEHPVQVGIQSINGALPDEAGNIQVTPEGIGALPNTGTAANAAKLGGVEASEYARKTDTVADADKLGGVAASEYLQKSNVVNDYTTTKEGFIADARILRDIDQRIKHIRYTSPAQTMSFGIGETKTYYIENCDSANNLTPIGVIASDGSPFIIVNTWPSGTTRAAKLMNMSGKSLTDISIQLICLNIGGIINW